MPDNPAVTTEPPEEPTKPLRLVVVTGMSGAGRSTAAHSLEDLGWYVIDNLPPSLLVEVCAQARRVDLTRVAVVLDVRTREFFEQLPTMFSDLSALGTLPEIVFLEATDDIIVRRQESVRRPHPLQGDGRLLDGIVRERETLATLRAAADLVIDTTSLNIHQLRSRVSHAYGGTSDDTLRVTLLSFGFKNGLPIDADMVFDVRFLPNPHFVDGLKRLDGRDAAVEKFVMSFEESRTLLSKIEDLLRFLLPLYRREGKAYLTVALGCTGGRHRSVTLVELLRRSLEGAGLTPVVRHRDVDRE
jgi:RNase adapter protein RapZ